MLRTKAVNNWRDWAVRLAVGLNCGGGGRKTVQADRGQGEGSKEDLNLNFLFSLILQNSDLFDYSHVRIVCPACNI